MPICSECKEKLNRVAATSTSQESKTLKEKKTCDVCGDPIK